MAYTTKYASVGSISSGTLLADDLVSAFAGELDYQLSRQVTRFPRKAHRALILEAYSLLEAEDRDVEELAYMADELQEALGEFAPPYGYFGTLEGDGAEFGFYMSDPREGGFDGLEVRDTSEVPRAYRGEVLHINDHGNMSLYYANGRGRLREIWAVV